MFKEIEEVLEKLAEDPEIKMVAIYRIDGMPVHLIINAPKRELSELLYWLEKQVNNMLWYIFTKNLKEVSFKFDNFQIFLYPISKTLVLGVIASLEASLYRLQADIKTTCLELVKILKNEM